MSLPLLTYTPSSKNQRVAGFEVAGDEKPWIYSTDNLLSSSDLDNLIEAAYRQLFFRAFEADRERFLESQLRNGQITVRDFVRGLVLSNTFRKSFYDLNNNYRFVEQVVERVLGREVYNEREKIAWSIVVATKGIVGFIDQLLNSEEYLDNFGYNTVPYRRRRVLQGRSQGDLPTDIKLPRYEDYYRAKLGFPQIIWQTQVRRYVPQDKKPKAGDPSLFLSMAQGIDPQGNPPQRMFPYNIDIEQSVPYRKLAGIK
ncbi:phycobilisome rod-core linker polypeptide [Aetokthonos hydrillicola]|uniref:phycobilisome rod-core linker polypeptide n=1 Tax=Aetokthonos hydrillicola TaxID=1550245 RepID=UPI001ABB7AB6